MTVNIDDKKIINLNFHFSWDFTSDNSHRERFLGDWDAIKEVLMELNNLNRKEAQHEEI